MTQFSANLGFLWTELALPEAICAAKAAGFSAVECHWPFEVPSSEVSAALTETGLPMLGLNTWRGDIAKGDFGLTAVPGREDEAREYIEEAIQYAASVNAYAVHVMAGNARGEDAHKAFIKNLIYACYLGEQHDVAVLIEPINAHDAPGYFLTDTQQAISIIAEVGAANLKLMFDCYHVGRTEGDVLTTLRSVYPHIGHIQFASVPDRGAPDHGEVDYRQVFAEIARLDWTKPLGAEYRPEGETETSLDWMRELV